MPSSSSSSHGDKLESDMQSFSVFVYNASGLRNVETFGKLDPYVIIICGKERVTSPVFNNAGVNPTFNLHFKMRYQGNKSITFCVKDKKSLGKDKECGKYKLDLDSDKLSRKIVHHGIPLAHGKKTSGTLNLGIKFQKDSVSKSECVTYNPDEESPEKKDKIEVPHNFKSLRLVVYKAYNLKETGEAKIDPFVEVKLGKQKVKSEPLRDGGVNPKIRTAFILPYDSEREVNVKFMDDGESGDKDKAVGSVKVDLMPFFIKESLGKRSKGGRMTLALKGSDSAVGGAMDCSVTFSDDPVDEPTVIQLKTHTGSSSSSSS